MIGSLSTFYESWHCVHVLSLDTSSVVFLSDLLNKDVSGIIDTYVRDVYMLEKPHIGPLLLVRPLLYDWGDVSPEESRN